MSADPSGRSLFIVDNSVSGWTGLRYLQEWAGISRAFDIATGFFEIGALLALDGEWQRLDRIRLLMGAETGRRTRFESRFSLGLVLGALNNLIDNSVYWLQVRWPDRPADSSRSPRRLLIDVSRELEGGPAIVVADSGIGFQDVPQHLARPFFTRKPHGMGLGLYYANLAMELNGGRLAFPQPGEVEVPSEYDGAVVAMIFKEA